MNFLRWRLALTPNSASESCGTYVVACFTVAPRSGGGIRWRGKTILVLGRIRLSIPASTCDLLGGNASDTKGLRKMACNKKRHESKEAAIAFNRGMEAYRCEECKAWHLTSGMRGRIYRAQGACTPHEAKEWLRRKDRRR